MTLLSELPEMEAWFKDCMRSEGYRLDGSMDSIKACDAFLDAHVQDGEPDADIAEQFGPICLAMAFYVGNTLLRYRSGRWEPDAQAPDDEIGLMLVFDDTTVCWPCQRVMKRVSNGPEDGLYAYALGLVDPNAIRGL